MARTEVYNQAACSVTFDGETVTHFMDGDSIRFTPADGGSSITNGLDGASTSFANVRYGDWEIDLKPVSPILDRVYRMKDEQDSGRGRLFDITVTTGVGEFVSFNGCGIVNDGGITAGGDTMAGRTISGTYQRRKVGL